MKDAYVVSSGAVELGVVNAAYDCDGAETAGRKTSVSSETSAKEEQQERAQWSNGVEFLMSCIAMSVGLGNVWRFPFTAYKNGGGAFLVPYVIVLSVVGKPLYYLEMTLGQFSSSGTVKVWNVVPALKGLGYGQVWGSALLLSYYCSIMALTTYYFAMSFQSPLPWAYCPEDSEDLCFDSAGEQHLNASSNASRISSSALYLQSVLNEVETLDAGVGWPDWRLTLCLLFSWLCVFAVAVRGVKSSGKAAYFLALFPYVVLVALLIKGVSLPGAVDGILYFIRPQWHLLLRPEVWYEAVTQCFFSLGVCFGTLVMYSSYNGFTHNVHRDALIVTAMDTVTSLLAGCTIFAILGNLQHETGAASIDEVAKKGAELAFLSYPEAIAKFDYVPQVFSVLFFLMLFTLGVGSAVALEGSVVTALCDQFPRLRYSAVVGATCVGGFLVGLVYITPGGQWVLTLVDFYGVQFIIFILATVEMMALAWVYGVDELCLDVEFMLRRRVGWYWRLSWFLVTPLLLLVILVYSLATMPPLEYHGLGFPLSAKAAGWVIFLFGVLQVPFWLCFQLLKNRHLSMKEVVMMSFRSSDSWGPKNPQLREEWRKFKEDRKRERRMEECGVCRKLLHKLTGCGRTAQ